jgi:hypothetical protein
MALDTTVYTDAAGLALRHPPHLKLRGLFARYLIPERIRLSIARHVESADISVMANLHDDLEESIVTLNAICENTLWAGPPGIQNLDKTRVKALIGAAKELAKGALESESKAFDDPMKYPAIPENDKLLMRTGWLRNHQGLELNKWNTPHSRFIDRIKADFGRNGRVRYYQLQEIRVEAEEIKSRPAVQLHCDNILQAVQQELPGSTVDSAQQLFERVFALFVALEFVEIFTPALFLSPGLKYYYQLQTFHRDHGQQLAYVLMADTKIRREVDRLTVEDPAISFAEAFNRVLDNHKYLWDSAISQVETDKLTSRSHQVKRPADPTAASPPSKRAKKKSKGSPKGRKQVNLVPNRSSGGKGAGGRQPSAASESSSPRKIPRPEMDKIMSFIRSGQHKKACKWYNSSAGCSQGEGCIFEHKCCQCGLRHAWADQHK